MSKRVLICANPDLNFIDGSSIWLQTIALAVAATGKASVDFIAKSRPERAELFAPVQECAAINIIDGSAAQHWQGKNYRRITLPMMAELAIKLHQQQPYDVVIVRGTEIATSLLAQPQLLARCWLYLTDIPQSVELYSPELKQQMRQLAQGCGKLLCQTSGFKALWQQLVPDLAADKIDIYTPVIPDLPAKVSRIDQRLATAIYAGKFKGDWMTLEMAQCWRDIHRQVVGSELLMVGDKIHKEPNPANYHELMQQALENTPGLTWLGAQSREEVQHLLRQARVGLSWRAESMNDTVEYSTKILEYGGAGCAAILNRNSLHEDLLGQDYPLYANSEAEFKQQLTRALSDTALTQRAADILRELAKRHTFSSRVNELKEWLNTVPVTTATSSKKATVLVAGHDLKFFSLLQSKLTATGQFEFITDQWQGHNKHDEAASRKLLQQADIIFCEWCLGNIAWYSHNKLPHQRLVARFHAQETRADYLNKVNWQAIDHITFVSEHIRRAAMQAFPALPLAKTSVIANYLDSDKFTPKKKTGDAPFTLGMVGVAPKSKRLDRAVDLLEALLATDSRYQLRVKGKHPLEYSWLLNRPDELAYYQQLFERINSNPQLRYKVIFDPAGDNVNDWFTMVGYILSPSEHESFHMAIGEGMLTGAVPVIWNWEGANEIWPKEHVVSSLAAASQLVQQTRHDVTAIRAKALAIANTDQVLANWTQFLAG